MIGYGDRRYLISQPTLPYDEVRIAFAAVVSALEGIICTASFSVAT